MIALPAQLIGPTPAPDDVRARILREAIRHYETLQDLHEEAIAALAADPALDRWCSWLIDLQREAERSLLGTILATDPAIAAEQLDEAIFEFQRPRGVTCAGKLYLAVCDPDLTSLDDPEGNQAVRLVVMPWADVAVLAVDGAAALVINPLGGAEGGAS